MGHFSSEASAHELALSEEPALHHAWYVVHVQNGFRDYRAGDESEVFNGCRILRTEISSGEFGYEAGNEIRADGRIFTEGVR